MHKYLENLLGGAKVEWKKFGDIANIYRGASPRPINDYITEDINGINWIKIGDIKPEDKYITSTKEKITQDGAKKSRFVKYGDFILSNSMSFGRPYILKIDGCIHDGWLSISDFDKDLISDYLYHLLNTKFIQKEMYKKASSGTVRNLNAEVVRSLFVPVPPLSIQTKIVTIMDKFSELTAEYSMRREQCQYYRNKLLKFNDKNIVYAKLKNITFPVSNIKWKDTTLSYVYIDLTSVDRLNNHITNIANITKATAPSRAQQLLKINDILFATTRPTQQRYCIITEAYNNSIASTGYCVLRADEAACLPKWIYHHMGTTNFKQYLESNQSGSAYPAISDSLLKEYKIPLPSLKEQSRIVAILDKFDALTNSITEGLPAEIELRKKQYEYYRDLLFDFPKPAQGAMP